MLARLKSFQLAWRSLAETSGRYLVELIDGNKTLKTEISALSAHFLGDEPRGCSNCYYDAFIRLNLIKTENMNKRDELYILRRGEILRDNKGDSSKLMSRLNTTEKLALYHLKTNPACRDFFETLPENIDELLNPKTKEQSKGVTKLPTEKQR